VKYAGYPSLQKLALIALAGFVPAVGQGADSDVTRAEEVQGDVTASLWQLLLPVKGETEPNLDQISAAIARLGNGAILPSVAIMFGDEPEPDFTYEIYPSVIDRRQDIILGALRRFPQAEVVAAVRARAATQPNVDRSLFTARILGRIGGQAALEAIEWLAGTLDEVQWRRPYVVTVFDESLVAIAKEDPRYVRGFAAALARTEVRCAPVFVHALGVAQWPAGVPVLLKAIGRDRDLDLCIMFELAKIGDRGDINGASAEIAKVRAYCEGADSGFQRIAASALARLGDEDSCGAIIAMLDSKNTMTISSAEKSLTTLTGISLGRDSKAWTEWHEQEVEWFETNHARLLEEIASGELKRASDAIREFAAHKLYRHEAALAVQPLLLNGDFEAQRQACTALGVFRSGRALPWLLDKLDEEEVSVQQEAWATLKGLTGLELPADAEAWRNVIVCGS
jgi:hypothetical protein